MKFLAKFLLVTIFFAMGAFIAALAQEDQSLPALALKTKRIVEAAYEYVSQHSGDMSAVQHALQTNPDFFDHDNKLYVFIHCYNIEKKEAICCGQGIRPELVGKNMWQLRTPNGRLLFYEIAQMVEEDGEGWIEYDWLDPYTKTLLTKRSYVKGIVLQDGQKAWVGCGYWNNSKGEYQSDDKK